MNATIETAIAMLANGKSARDCPDASKHSNADQPEGYIDAADWAEEKSKTHVQEQCPTCGFWVMWRAVP